MGLVTFKQKSTQLHSPGFGFHPGPVDLRVRLRGSRWIHLLAPVAIPDAAEATLRCKTLEVVVIDRDEPKRHTTIRIASRGKPVLTFSATGPVDGPMTVVKFESDRKYASVIKERTIEGARAAILRLADAKPRRLTVERRDDVTVLRAADGRALGAKDLHEAYMVEYEVVSAADSPASVALQSAIDDADPVAVRRAIRKGANLEYLPGLMTSPLDWALLKRKGRWLACVKTLVEAGASLEGGPDQDPAIVVAADNSGATQESTIEVIDYLLKLGVSIETRGRSSANAEATPLHVAANNGMLGVVVHLVRHGADVLAALPNRTKASDLPRQSHTFLGDEHRAVRDFLLAVERGEIRPATLNPKAIARQADQLRAGVKDAIRDWARATRSPIAVLFAASQPPTIAKPARSRTRKNAGDKGDDKAGKGKGR